MLLVLALAARAALAGEASVLAAEFVPASDGSWRVSVTLEHADAGWEHYADAWRVVDSGGAVLGTRTLYHPHDDEQPFTRSLDGVRIPGEGEVVYVEAHDKVHGWGTQRLEVDLSRLQAGRVRVER